MLKWNETDVMTCLEVEPQMDEARHGISYDYTVHKHDLTLKLGIWPMDGDVIIDLFQNNIDAPLFVMKIIDSPQIEYNNKNGKEWLEIAAGNCAQNRYDSDSLKVFYGLKISVKPSIQIESFQAEMMG